MSIPRRPPWRSTAPSSSQGSLRRRRAAVRRFAATVERCEDRLLMANASLLGAAQSFAVLGATTVTNTGPSLIFGDLGVSPGTAVTGFPPGVVTGGTIHAGDAAATQAHADLATAYGVLAAEVPTTLLSGDLGGLTLLPGIYQFATSAQLNGTLTLDAQGDPNASFEFQVGTTLITASNSAVTLINGARGDNVFFQVGSSATLGADTAFAGNIVANTSITLTTGASIAEGRALAVNGAVTLDTNAVSITPAFLSVDNVTVNEGAGTASFTVTLSRPSGLTVTVQAATADGTALAAGDYTNTSALVAFAPGQVTRTFTVPVSADSLHELSETFTVNLSAPSNATIADAQGVGTILDDDTAPLLSIGDATVLEGAAAAVFTVALSAVSGLDVSVAFATADGSALAGLDYSATSGLLTIPAGSLSATVAVPILGDALDERDETFLVNLSAPANATIADSQGLGTILDDDVSPTASIGDATVPEGAGAAVFTVTLSAVSGLDVTVGYGSADGSALAGLDYTATSGTLLIPAGSLTGTIAMPVVADAIDETDESFTVNLSAPSNATLADAQGIGTILDDDTAPSVPIPNAPPVSVNDSFGTAQGTALVVVARGVLANDTDDGGGPLTAALVSAPSNGTLTLNRDGSFAYTPSAGFTGVDAFTYRAGDGAGQSGVATATITVRDVTGPAVPSLLRFGFHSAPTFLVLTFDQPLDPARAGNAANYRLTGPSGAIGLRSAVYDEATRTVTLSPSRLLPLSSRYKLTIAGSTAGGVADRSGNPIDGDGDGRPGGDATLRFGREALRALATHRTRNAPAGLFRVPAANDGGLLLKLFQRMSTPRYRWLLARR